MPGVSVKATYAETIRLVSLRPELSAFGPFDCNASAAAVGVRHVPAVSLLKEFDAPSHPDTAPLVAAVIAMATDACWRRTYSESEVGRDFLDRYGYFELVGPRGHFHSVSTRAYIGFWDAGLHYPWHVHEAEELYFVLAGEAKFQAKGQETAVLGPGDSRFHVANQPHAMTTGQGPVLTLVLWRGVGADCLPRMGHR